MQKAEVVREVCSLIRHQEIIIVRNLSAQITALAVTLALAAFLFKNFFDKKQQVFLSRTGGVIGIITIIVFAIIEIVFIFRKSQQTDFLLKSKATLIDILQTECDDCAETMHYSLLKTIYKN